jgi:putative intracellular protease/amidase
MTDFVWPSDIDRAENDELNRVCEYAEELYDTLQASRQGVDGEPNSSEAVAWSWENHGRQVTVDKAFADELISDGEIVRPLIFGDTHPASAVTDDEYIRALQDACDIIQADANTEQNYESLCRIGGVLARLKSNQEQDQ